MPNGTGSLSRVHLMIGFIILYRQGFGGTGDGELQDGKPPATTARPQDPARAAAARGPVRLRAGGDAAAPQMAFPQVTRDMANGFHMAAAVM
ncbi:hypothetical protein ACFY1L_35200 [Streptomyces sp. NPDC001663]|uniref:hypothetical protein n=1 Tax=Streptomyces sp. NPDC001663 TaxID=3364597 RepID=UPI0036D00ACD